MNDSDVSKVWEVSPLKENRRHDSQGHRIHCEDCASVPAYLELIHTTPDGLETVELCRECLWVRVVEKEEQP